MNKNEFTLKYLEDKGFTVKNGMVLKSQKEDAREAVWLNTEFEAAWDKYFRPYWQKLVRSSFPIVDGEKPIYTDDTSHKTVWRVSVYYKSKPEMVCVLECGEGLGAPLGKLSIFNNKVSDSYFEPVMHIKPALSTDDPEKMKLVRGLTADIIKGAYGKIKKTTKKPAAPKMTRKQQIEIVKPILAKWPSKALRDFFTEAYDDVKEVSKMTKEELVDSYLKNLEDQGMLLELAEQASQDGNLDGDLEHIVDMYDGAYSRAK